MDNCTKNNAAKQFFISHAKGVILAAGDNGFSLPPVQVVHFKQRIVHITRLICESAVHHIKENANFRLSAFFMHFIDLLKHLLIIQSGDAGDEILGLAHAYSCPFGIGM